MTTPWEAVIKLIQNGWNVDAQHTNLPIDGLTRRTQYLKEFLESIQAGEALILRDQQLDSSTTWLGSPVYWNTTNTQFEGAQALFDTVAGQNYGLPAEEALVRGIVVAKTTATQGDIMLYGLWRDANISAVITGAVAGPLYLSPSAAGTITQDNVPGRITVGYYNGTDVFVDRAALATINEHVHYRFELVTDPASSNSGAAKLSLSGGKYSIVAADSGVPGWLPASDPSFSGLAPAGAKFGYNLAQHASLQEMWPPAPVTAYSVELTNAAPPEASIVPEGVIIVDENGLWWMDDCEAQCPWENPYPNPAADPNLCTHDRKMVFWFTKFSHLTDQSMVQSLTPCTDSPIQIEVRDCVTGNPASTGNLCLYLDSVLEYDPTNPTDPSVAVKEIVDNKYRMGPAVASVRSTSSRLQVSGTDLGGKYSGNVVLTLNELGDSLVDVPELVALNNAREEVIQDCSYLEFPASRVSSAVYKISLPPTLGAVTVKLYAWMMADEVSASAPGLNISYRIFPNPSGVVSLTSTKVAMATGFVWPFSSVTVPRQYAQVESLPVTANGGNIVLFEVGREVGSYAGNVGLLKVYFQTSAV